MKIVHIILKLLKFQRTKLLPGYTIAELLVVMAIFATLIGIATINLVGAKQKASLNTSIDLLIADLKNQQLKTMIGNTEGFNTADSYGIHFNTNSYTLFKGASYDPNSGTNFTVDLGDNVFFVSTPTELVFARVSGELTANGEIEIMDNTTKQLKTIIYNRYGVVTDVN